MCTSLTKKTKGSVEDMSNDKMEILFEGHDFSLYIYCDIDVEEYPYYTPGTHNDPPEGSIGGLNFTITGGKVIFQKESVGIKGFSSK